MNKFSKLFLGSILALGLASCGEKPTPTPTPEEKVNVTFDYNYETFDETATSPAAKVVEVVKGEKVAKPAEDPQWSGWTFVQWCTTQAAVTAFDFTAPILADTTIYAAWREEGAAFDTWTLVGSFDPSSEAGTGDQWNPNSDTYKLATEDGIHYSIAGVSMKPGLEFQVIKEHDWAGQLQAGKVNKEASTPNCYSGEGGNNIKIELGGVYTVDVDLSVAATPITLTKTADLDVHNIGYSVNVLGAFNGWAPQNADVEGNGHLAGDVALSGTYTGVVAMEAGQTFKVTVLSHFDDESTSIEWFGPAKYAALVDDVNVGSNGDNDPNYEALKNGDYTFTVVIPAEGPNALTINVSVEEKEGPSEKPMLGSVGLVGTINSWGGSEESPVDDIAFVQADPTKREYTLTYDLHANDEIKVRGDHSWTSDLNAGYGDLTTAPDAEKVADKGGNIQILVDGTYDFVLELTELNKVKVFTISAHEGAVTKYSVSYVAWINYEVTDKDVIDFEASTLPTEVAEGDFTFVVVLKQGYTLAYVGETNDNDWFSAELTFTFNVSRNLEFNVMVNEAPASEPDEVKTSVTFSEKGYTNAEAVSSVEGENFTITFDKGTASSEVSYYDTGAAIRVYGGGSFTVTSEYKITKITLGFGSGDKTNEITVDCGSFTSPDWTGEANSVKFSVGGTSGHRRIATVEVTVLK